MRLQSTFLSVQFLACNGIFSLQAYIEGYTELLGISTYCRLNLTMTRMELLIQGNFLGLIKAELFVSASYSLSFVGAQFYVRVTVDLSGINNVRKILQCVYHPVTKECIFLFYCTGIMLPREEVPFKFHEGKIDHNMKASHRKTG